MPLSFDIDFPKPEFYSITEHWHWESALERELFELLRGEDIMNRILGSERLDKDMRSRIANSNRVKAMNIS